MGQRAVSCPDPCDGSRGCAHAVQAAVVAVAGEWSLRPLPRLFPQLKSRSPLLFAKPFFPRIIAVVQGAAGAAGLDPPVNITDLGFDPAVITAHPGETIVWTNRGVRTHRVTPVPGALGRPPGSADIVPGGTHSWTPGQGDVGTWAYQDDAATPPWLGTVVVTPVPVVVPSSVPGVSLPGGVVVPSRPLPSLPGPPPAAPVGSIQRPENWAWRRYSGTPRADGIVARVADDRRLSLEALRGIGGVATVDYYANQRQIILTCDPSQKATIMDVLNRLPGIWFSEDDYSVPLRGCADNAPCGNAGPVQWLDACRVPQAWCVSIVRPNKVFFFEAGGTAGADCGLENLDVFATDSSPNVPNHADRVVPYAIATGQCMQGAAPGNRGLLYYGESFSPSPGLAFLTYNGRIHCANYIASQLREQSVQIQPGDVFVDYGVTDSAWMWAFKALKVAGVNYSSQGTPAYYSYLAASFGQADGARRSLCSGGFGMLCVLPQFQGQDHQCRPCSAMGNYCNSSAAGPALAGLLSLDRRGVGWSSGMRRANALARACSNYPRYSTENGFGVPDACLYMDKLQELGSRSFHFVPNFSETTIGEYGEWTRLSLALSFASEDGGPPETHGLNQHVRDFEVRCQIATPQGDVNVTQAFQDVVGSSYLNGFQADFDLQSPPWRRGTTLGDLRNYNRRYIAGGRVGFNSFYGVQQFSGGASSVPYQDPAGENFWPWRRRPS